MGDMDQYSNRLEFEHELINRRLTWLLTSQSILFAAYGLAISENTTNVFLKVTPVAGIGISCLIFVGVLCGVFAKWNTWQDSGEKEFGVRTWITILALLPDLMLPVVFACAWTWIRLSKPGWQFWLVLVIGVSITVLTLHTLLLKGFEKKVKMKEETSRKRQSKPA